MKIIVIRMGRKTLAISIKTSFCFVAQLTKEGFTLLLSGTSPFKHGTLFNCNHSLHRDCGFVKGPWKKLVFIRFFWISSPSL